MARIPIQTKWPNKAGYVVLNTETNRLEIVSDGEYQEILHDLSLATKDNPGLMSSEDKNNLEKLISSTIVEEGENVNGKYIKYENGIIICYMFNFPFIDPEEYNHLYVYYPFTFIDIPYSNFFIAKYGIGGGTNFFVWAPRFIYNNMMVLTGRLASDTDISPNYDMSSLGERTYFAIGRWK